MDKEKLKRYAGRFAGYVGLGILGGGLSLITLTYIFEINWCWSYGCATWFPNEGLYPMFLGLLGGLIGGAIAKKWWSALLGGFLMTEIIYILIVFFW